MRFFLHQSMVNVLQEKELYRSRQAQKKAAKAAFFTN